MINRNAFTKKLKYALLCLALLAFASAVIILPDRYVSCCLQGFLMWAECVLPSLFPFMVITLIFVKTGVAEKAALPLRRVAKKLNLPAVAGTCYLLSVCSGYPAGSRVVSEFYHNGACNAADCRKLAYLCSSSGPLFIIGSVGYRMFGDKVAGLKIFAAHLVSITVIGLIIAILSPKSTEASAKNAKYSGNALYDSFYGAVLAVTVAGGFIAFFYVVAAFCADFSLFYPLEFVLEPLMGESTAEAVCSGLIEATTGCRALSANPDKLSIALAGFLITFGGLSIILQQLSYLTAAGVKPLKFIAVKFLQGLTCFGILMIIA